MNTWLQFLNEQGATLSESPRAEVLGFTQSTSLECPSTDYVAPLRHLGLIAASGEDAANFLHNQLTNDVLHLDQGQARLAGYCTPKGRLLATFLLWRNNDTILLQLSREIQPTLQKRLQMFIMRAKAKLTDVSDESVVLGLAGTVSNAALAHYFPSLPAAPLQTVSSGHGTLIRVADAGDAPRYQWITTPDNARTVWPDLTKTLQPAAERAWRLSEIRAGIPHVTPATQEQFVPQMVNYELIDGVNFKKGCYPGQEIVARSQYLGKLKRRMMLASVIATDAAAGNEVFSSGDPEQPCGMIVNVERETAERQLCLVELKLAALDAGAICLRSATGSSLEFQSLPYDLSAAE